MIRRRAATVLRLVSGPQRRAGETNDSKLVLCAERILDLRRRRVDDFGSAMFGEPAWDMLLAAYVAEQRQDSPTIASLTSITGVSPSVALRWLTFLIGEGLAERIAHPTQSDQMLIRLTNRSRDALKRYLARVLEEKPA